MAKQGEFSVFLTEPASISQTFLPQYGSYCVANNEALVYNNKNRHPQRLERCDRSSELLFMATYVTFN